MTHDELTEMARVWLRGNQGCSVVITEMTCGASHCPDAIGFHPCYSIIIECKTSRSDFLRDRHKGHMQTNHTMGDKRYYLAPKGVLFPKDMPPGYGLLEPSGKGLKKIVYPQWIPDKDRNAEITLLVSAMRRLGGNVGAGVSVRAYQYDSKGRATLGIKEMEDAKKPID